MGTITDAEATKLADEALELSSRTSADSVALLRFARNYAVTSQLRNRMTLAVARLNQAPNDDEADEAWDEITAAIEAISRERRDATVEQIEEKQSRLRRLEELSLQEPHRETVFRCEGLGYEYPNGKFALSDVSIELKEGEITGIFGGNANGKTTLFKLVVGQLAQTAGELTFPLLEPKAFGKPTWRVVKSDIAYVPQELPALHGTMEENLRFAAANSGVTGADNDLALDYIVNRLDLKPYLKSKWNELSGGFKLRIALGKALITKPKLLALDEPLANLDYISQLSVLRDIRALASSFRDPIAVLMTSQHLHEIEAIADKILFLERGRVKYYGEPGGVGSSSAANLFELDADVSERELREIFPAAKGFGVTHNGISFVIQASNTVTPKTFLALLADHGVVPNYFRDISNSVKQFFTGTRFDTSLDA